MGPPWGPMGLPSLNPKGGLTRRGATKFVYHQYMNDISLIQSSHHKISLQKQTHGFNPKARAIDSQNMKEFLVIGNERKATCTYRFEKRRCYFCAKQGGPRRPKGARETRRLFFSLVTIAVTCIPKRIPKQSHDIRADPEVFDRSSVFGYSSDQ